MRQKFKCCVDVICIHDLLLAMMLQVCIRYSSYETTRKLYTKTFVIVKKFLNFLCTLYILQRKLANIIDFKQEAFYQTRQLSNFSFDYHRNRRSSDKSKDNYLTSITVSCERSPDSNPIYDTDRETRLSYNHAG